MAYRKMMDFSCVTSSRTEDMHSRLFPLIFLPPPKGSSCARNPPEPLTATMPVLKLAATFMASWKSFVMTPELRP